MKTCLYLTLLTTLCCTLAHAYPEDNYVFDRSGISYMTAGENTIFCIKGGSVVPMNAGFSNNEVGIPEAARENVVKVQAVENEGGAALRRDGRLAVWGSPFSDSEHGSVDVAYVNVSARHTRTVTNVVDIAALHLRGIDFPDSPTPLYMLMEDGTVRVFGENGEDLPIIPLHPDITDPVALVGNYYYVAVLDASGIARMIYNDINNIDAVSTDRLHPLRDIASIGGACAIHTDGTVSSFDSGNRYTVQQAFFDGLTDQTIVQVDTDTNGGGRIMAVTANGELLTHNLPTHISTLPTDLASNAKQVILSGSQCFGIDRDGRAYLWGRNASGDRSEPGQTEIHKYLNSPVITTAFGNAHGIVLRTDGTVRGWGDDTHGQASGLNGVTNAVAVAADADYSLALLADGTVVGAGNDTHGQIAGLSAFTDVIDIAAGEEHSLVTFRDGTVSGAGNDADGRISGLSDLQGVLDIEAGFDHSVARYGEREIFCAGNNELGQCDIPAKVANANYVLDIAAGYRTSAAVTYTKADADGSVIEFADSNSQGIAGTLSVWGAHEEERYQKNDKLVGFAFYRSVALGDNAVSPAIRLSAHIARGVDLSKTKGDSDTITDSYRSGFSGGGGSWASEYTLAESECHMLAAGGRFHAAIAGNGRLRVFPDLDKTKSLDDLSEAQRSVLYPPRSIYELASDGEITTSSLLQLSTPHPGIEIRTLAGDTYVVETNTDLLDTNGWTRLPRDSNTRMYRLRKQ